MSLPTSKHYISDSPVPAPSTTTKVTQLCFPLHLVLSLSLLLVLAQINGCWWAKVLSTAESHSTTLYNFLLCSCSILVLPASPATFRRHYSEDHVWLEIHPWRLVQHNRRELFEMFVFEFMHFARHTYLKRRCFKSEVPYVPATLASQAPRTSS